MHPRGGEAQVTKELKYWYKNGYFSGDQESLDPYEWNVKRVNEELIALATRPWIERLDDPVRAPYAD